MKEKDSTKDKFIKSALILFSEKGYDGVTVQDIADSVGVTAPALYKHFKGKKELYEAILDDSIDNFENSLASMKLDFKNNADQVDMFLNMTEEEQIESVKNLFLHLVHDERISAFRRFMTVEQYKMPELAKMLNERYIYCVYDQHEILYRFLIEQGFVKNGEDPRALAVMFISPVMLLIGLCDREPEKEQWALETIEQHIRSFNKAYRIK